MAFATNSRIAVFLLLGSTSIVPAEQAAIEVESLLQQYSHPIAIEDGALRGPGAAFLASAAAGTQFVALGEAHNNREIPQFATALFRLLHEREGFEFLILEHVAGRRRARDLRVHRRTVLRGTCPHPPSCA